MRETRPPGAALLFLLLYIPLLVSAIRGEELAVLLDGAFDEWSGVEALASDPVGDAPAGRVDVGRIFVANDDHALYFRLELNRETIWQNPLVGPAGNDLRLFLDADGSVDTGTRVAGLGIDLEVGFGEKEGFLFEGAAATRLSLNEMGLIGLPTHSADAFEFALPFHIRRALGEPELLITGPTVRFFLGESQNGDRAPNSGFLEYGLAPSTPPALDPIPFARSSPDDVRILCHNVEFSSPIDEPEPFVRYLQALQPDIVCFQEMWNWNAEQTKQFVVAALDPGGAVNWSARQVDDNVTVSRWPILEDAAVVGNLAILIDLPDDRASVDLVLYNVHTPCCGDNSGRDFEHDAIAASWRAMLNGTGQLTVAPDDAVVMLGDFNMVGFARQLHSVRDGDIFDNATWGPDFAPGRAQGSLQNAPLRHTHGRHIYTWRSDPSSFAPGKLDYLLFSGDTATLRRNFTLYTPDLPDEVLLASGLQREDSVQASDHLVMVADFRFKPPATAALYLHGGNASAQASGAGQ